MKKLSQSLLRKKDFFFFIKKSSNANQEKFNILIRRLGKIKKMPDSVSKEIERGLELIFEEKIEEAFDIVKIFEKKEELTREDNLMCQVLKGTGKLYLGKFEEALEIATMTFQESKKLKNPLVLIESFMLKFQVFYFYDRSLEIWNEFRYCEKILKPISHESSSEIDQAAALLNWLNSWLNWAGGQLDLALEFLNKSLEFFKRRGQRSLYLDSTYLLFGFIYENKGEIELALNYLNKCLDCFKGNSVINKSMQATVFFKIGDVYYQQGNLDLAADYHKKSLKIFEHIDIPVNIMQTYWVYNALIKLLLDKNSPELAKGYLQSFNQYNKDHEKWSDSRGWYNWSYSRGWYILSEARILKSSKRIRDKAKAEKILREVLEGKLGVKIIGFDLLRQLTVEICDFYLGELSSTNDLKILDDIQPYITRLFNESKRTNSYSLQSHTSLLQGKLSLLQMNMGEARKHLTKAQRIAEDHGLQLLAREISKEHDKLLGQLDKWEILKRKEVSISERMDLAGLEDYINLMQGRRMIKAPELVEEDSILLLIMGHEGITYFNYTFVENFDFEDLFSSFMSAFNTFSSEIFSKSIDRIKIDENMILIKPIESFLVCYVIKGQSYPALQKLNRFSDAIKWKSDIWEALNKAVQTGETLDLTNPLSLGEVVNEIFKH